MRLGGLFLLGQTWACISQLLCAHFITLYGRGLANKAVLGAPRLIGCSAVLAFVGTPSSSWHFHNQTDILHPFRRPLKPLSSQVCAYIQRRKLGKRLPFDSPLSSVAPLGWLKVMFVLYNQMPATAWCCCFFTIVPFSSSKPPSPNTSFLFYFSSWTT